MFFLGLPLFYCVRIYSSGKLVLLAFILFEYIIYIPRKRTMSDEPSYQKSHKSLLQLLEKITRYQHHIAFVRAYIELKHISRGFLLKFHSNSNNTSYKFILKNCSQKLMISTVGYYKKLLPPLKVQFDRIKTIIADKWKEKYDLMSKKIIKRTKDLNNILALRRNNKFNRDRLDYELAVSISSNKLKNLQNNKNLKEDLKSKILAGQNIPTYDPLNLHKSNTPQKTGLTSLCRKGPSFVPVPPSYNWLQLLINFDSFRNRLRTLFI